MGHRSKPLLETPHLSRATLARTDQKHGPPILLRRPQIKTRPIQNRENTRTVQRNLAPTTTPSKTPHPSPQERQTSPETTTMGCPNDRRTPSSSHQSSTTSRRPRQLLVSISTTDRAYANSHTNTRTNRTSQTDPVPTKEGPTDKHPAPQGHQTDSNTDAATPRRHLRSGPPPNDAWHRVRPVRNMHGRCNRNGPPPDHGLRRRYQTVFPHHQNNHGTHHHRPSPTGGPTNLIKQLLPCLAQGSEQPQKTETDRNQDRFTTSSCQGRPRPHFGHHHALIAAWRTIWDPSRRRSRLRGTDDCSRCHRIHRQTNNKRRQRTQPSTTKSSPDNAGFTQHVQQYFSNSGPTNLSGQQSDGPTAAALRSANQNFHPLLVLRRNRHAKENRPRRGFPPGMPPEPPIRLSRPPPSDNKTQPRAKPKSKQAETTRSQTQRQPRRTGPHSLHHG